MDFDVILSKKCSSFVRRATSGPAGTPDWGVILQILSIIGSNPGTVPFFVSAICTLITKGSAPVRENAVMLVDALFKNAKTAPLKMLQSPVLMKYLSDPIVSDNPTLQNFVHKEAPEWVAACTAHHCLSAEFQKWQEKACARYFVRKLTSPIRKKFLDELNDSLELLDMFLQSLITSITDGVEDCLVDDMFPNVNEIARRLLALKPTIVDKQVLSAIITVHDFCDLCRRMHSDYKMNKKVSVEDAAVATESAKKKLAKIINMNTQKPPKKKVRESVDITVDEFFAEFDKIKESEQNETQNTDDLLSLLDLNN